MNDKFWFMESKMQEAFGQSDLRNCILDCEIVPFDFESRQVQCFQTMQKLKTINSKENNTNYKLIAFDILLLNDQ